MNVKKESEFISPLKTVYHKKLRVYQMLDMWHIRCYHRHQSVFRNRIACVFFISFMKKEELTIKIDQTLLNELDFLSKEMNQTRDTALEVILRAVLYGQISTIQRIFELRNRRLDSSKEKKTDTPESNP